MSKLDPKNRMEAYTHQLTDDVNFLMKLSLMNDERGYDDCLDKIENMIKAYRSPQLRKASKKTKAKYDENEKRYKKLWPDLYK